MIMESAADVDGLAIHKATPGEKRL
jgi:hypothetical protein